MRRVDCSASGLEVLCAHAVHDEQRRVTGRRYSVTLLFSHNSCHRGSDNVLWSKATNNELSLIYASGTKERRCGI